MEWRLPSISPTVFKGSQFKVVLADINHYSLTLPEYVLSKEHDHDFNCSTGHVVDWMVKVIIQSFGRTFLRLLQVFHRSRARAHDDISWQWAERCVTHTYNRCLRSKQNTRCVRLLLEFVYWRFLLKRPTNVGRIISAPLCMQRSETSALLVSYWYCTSHESYNKTWEVVILNCINRYICKSKYRPYTFISYNSYTLAYSYIHLNWPVYIWVIC